MDSGIAIRCGSCRGGGWLDGWFSKCAYCRGRGWFDPTTAPAGLGVLVAAADAVRTGAAKGLLVRPALPWEHFPVPAKLQGPGAPDESTWTRALRNSAVILYEHANDKLELAAGLELARLHETHEVIRELFWQTVPQGGLWRCVDRQLRDVYLQFSFFTAWRGEWLEVTKWQGDEAKRPPAAQTMGPTPTEITGEAQKYVTGKLFVGVPKDEK